MEYLIDKTYYIKNGNRIGAEYVIEGTYVNKKQYDRIRKLVDLEVLVEEVPYEICRQTFL